MFDIYVNYAGNRGHKYSSNPLQNKYEWIYQDEYNLMQNEYIIEAFKQWVDDNKIKTLNVAGNSTQTIPEMFELAATVLTYLLSPQF